MTVLGYLALNVAMMVLFGLLTNARSPLGYLAGYIAAFIALSIVYPEYGRRVVRALHYVLWLAWQIVLNAWQVGIAILSPKRPITPGIVAVPVRSLAPFELTVLASSITLTPGTIAVETGYDASGGRVLFVHALLLTSADDLRLSIGEEMERRILLFLRSRPPVVPPADTLEDDDDL